MIPSIQRLGPGIGAALLALAATAGAQQPEPKQAFQDIKKELEQEFRDLGAATKDMPDEEADRIREDFFANVLPDFAQRYAELARAQRGTPLAYDAWSEIVSLGTMSSVHSEHGQALLVEALESLVADHAQSESLAGFSGTLRYATSALGEERVTKTLADIAARTPHRAVKAAALYNLAAVLADERPADDAHLARAKTLLAELQRDFADVSLRGERSYAQAASAFVFALENLAVGKPCPDFQALDAEGAGFKLSDYKGKVVLVDFWGFW